MWICKDRQHLHTFSEWCRSNSPLNRLGRMVHIFLNSMRTIRQLCCIYWTKAHIFWCCCHNTARLCMCSRLLSILMSINLDTRNLCSLYLYRRARLGCKLIVLDMAYKPRWLYCKLAYRVGSTIYNYVVCMCEQRSLKFNFQGTLSILLYIGRNMVNPLGMKRDLWLLYSYKHSMLY